MKPPTSLLCVCVCVCVCVCEGNRGEEMNNYWVALGIPIYLLFHTSLEVNSYVIADGIRSCDG